MKRKIRWPVRVVIFAVLLGFLIVTAGKCPLSAQEMVADSSVSVEDIKSGGSTKLSTGQLDTLVAPIALYPDDLVANVLTAATVPLEIVQAARYLKENGGKIDDMPSTDWDPSVKALMKFPQVLNMMNEKLTWTQQLGDAVMNQQSDVMAAVQRQRKKAYDLNNLQSNNQQKVTVQQDNRQEIIEIQPSNPQVVYVPEYDPGDVYVQQYNPLAPLVAFGAGIAVADWWNYRDVNWSNNNIIVRPPYFHYYNYNPGQYYYNRYHYDGHGGYPPPPNNVWHPENRAMQDYQNRHGVPPANRYYHPAGDHAINVPPPKRGYEKPANTGNGLFNNPVSHQDANRYQDRARESRSVERTNKDLFSSGSSVPHQLENDNIFKSSGDRFENRTFSDRGFQSRGFHGGGRRR